MSTVSSPPTEQCRLLMITCLIFTPPLDTSQHRETVLLMVGDYVKGRLPSAYCRLEMAFAMFCLYPYLSFDSFAKELGRPFACTMYRLLSSVNKKSAALKALGNFRGKFFPENNLPYQNFWFNIIKDHKVHVV